MVSAATIVTLLAIVAALAVACPLVGRHLAAVFGDGDAPGDRFFDPIERRLFRLLGTSPEREQRWGAYAASLLAFSAVSVLVLYVLLRCAGRPAVQPDRGSGHAAVAGLQHGGQLRDRDRLAGL